ncbi:MAG: DUF6279 family lipoprotein [Burkholderiales bacterium]
MRLPLAHALLAAALVALLGACSSVTRIAYNNAGVALAWTVDDWFDLRDEQRDWLRERFAKLHAWHRASELPDYERLLQEMAALAATRTTAEDARRVYGEMRSLYARMLRRAIPDMADFLLQVKPGQVEHLERRFVADNAEKEKEVLGATPRERREARAKRYLGRIEDWTGRLSEAQRERARARLDAMEDLGEAWLEDRRTRQALTLALLRGARTREAMVAGLERILLDTAAWRQAGYAARLRARDEQVFALVAELDATLTPEQRGRLHRRIAAWAADVAYLMASAG